MKKFFPILLTTLAVALAQSYEAKAQRVLTMEDALAYSEEHNPDLRNAKLNMERYELNLIAQKASLKSRFNLSLNPFTYSQSRSYQDFQAAWYTSENMSSSGTFSITQPIIWTDATLSLSNSLSWQNSSSSAAGSKSNSRFSNNLSLRLNQPIFTYNKTKMNMRNIELSYENAQISYALQRLRMEQSLTREFYNLYFAQKNLEITLQQLEDAEKDFEIIKIKVETEMSSKEELYQAELNLANSRSSAENQRVSLENSKDNFKQSIGLPLDEDVIVSAEIDNVESVSIDMERAVQLAFSSRLELRQREISAEQLEQQMIQAKDADSFSGNISLALGVSGDDPTFGKIYSTPTNSPSISISFSVPIFDWGVRKANIKSKEIDVKTFEIQSEEELKSMEISIRSSIRSLENLKRQIEIAEQSARNAQLTYDLNTERYRNGDLTGMQMNQYQSQLQSNKISYAQAQINYKMELLNIKILTLYDFENDEPILPLEKFKTSK